MILDKIVAAKKKELADQKVLVPENILDKEIHLINFSQQSNTFKTSVKREADHPLKIIAEIKKASPSRGIIRPDFNYKTIAQTYVEKKVDAISVLTDKQFFQGTLDYIKDLSQYISIPLLRKDFTIDRYHIKEALVAGARAVLLIASILTEKQLNSFIQLCDSYSLGYIVEIHDAEDLTKTLTLDHVDVIGINNRDLRTFTIDLKTTERLLKKIPKGTIVISESGIHTHQHAVYISDLGVDAVLIGEALMKHSDIAGKFDEIFGGLRHGSS